MVTNQKNTRIKYSFMIGCWTIQERRLILDIIPYWKTTTIRDGGY